MQNHANILVNHALESFEQFSEMAVSWQAEFRQLNTAERRTVIFQAQLGSILFSNARLGCVAEQRGTTPQGMRTFAIPYADSPPMNWFRHHVDSDSLLLFPGEGDIDVISQSGFGVSTFSVPDEILRHWLDQSTKYTYQQLLGSDEKVLKLSKHQSATLRRLLRIATEPAIHSSPEIVSLDIEERTISLLLEIFIRHTGKAAPARPAKAGALKAALDYSRGHSGDVVRVSDLCSASGVSERKLQYLFKRELGLTPRAYLMGQRLYRAHQALWKAEPGTNSVSGIAGESGFFHFGQFAAAYRKQFGELPSTTLRRAAG